MKKVAALLLLFTCSCLAGDLTTLDGTTYRNVKISRVEADGLVITHAAGGCKLDFLKLPEDVRKQYSFDPAKAEAARKAAASAATAGGGWQEMDQRLIFLTVQLSSVEASLAALNRALVSLGIQQVTRQSGATIAQQANEAMDRNAGGPVPWTEFYGRTAQKFFYHPTGQRTSYHTLTILRQQSPAWDTAPSQGVPSRQGLPVHQRPPQFDYIYRANADAEKRAQAEVARLGNNSAAILERRRQLEAEQAALWCKIAFRAVAGRELLSTPLYRSELKSSDDGTLGRQRMETLRTALDFLRGNHRLLEQVPKDVDSDPAGSYRQLQNGVATARSELDARLAAQPAAASDVLNRQTTIGKFAAVAKRMVAVTENISDAHRLALDGDRAGDLGRKTTFRQQLQQSLMVYAESLLAGDECVNELARDWSALPGMQTAGPASATVQPREAMPPPVVETRVAADGFVPLFNGRDLTGWTPMETTGRDDIHNPGTGGWSVQNNELVCVTSQSGWLKTERRYGDFVLQLDFKLRPDGNSGVYIRSPDSGHISGVAMEIQIIDSNYKGSAGRVVMFTGDKLTGAIWGVVGMSRPPERPIGEWNSMEIRCEGDNVEVTLNGTRTASANMSQEPKLRDRPRSGYIGLSNWHGEANGMSFRNIRIKELSAASSSASTPAVVAPASATAQASPANVSDWRFFVGEWQVGRPNRPDFTINLYDDFTARNSELKSGGTWMHVNGEARITWGISGWRNTIRREGEDFRKLGFGPGKSFDDTPTDTGAAVKIKPGASQVQSSTASAAAGSSAPTPAAVAPQPAAQSGQAWINSLGMRFVPVSGTSVQFSIWDTRVQDYQAFVRATGRSWSKPEFKQGPTHPAVNIKWNDAKAFCAWLTEKERRAGTLNSTQEYRLPTDLEWSVAVGLEHETGNTPGERNHSIEGVYPWGTQWPPPRGAGNYFSTLNVDDFANTSPVGSFAANRFGLYDMGGNVWQWCEDYYDGVSGTHFLRGGNFGQAARGGMLSSFRAKYDSDQFGRRDQGNGFRCVLAGGGASTSR